MSTLNTTNLKNPSSGSNNVILNTDGTIGGSCLTQTCRAWVNFNGTGTVAIRASYNVSSITDNGVGDYTVNFTNAMTDANYSATGNSYVVSGLIGIIVENQVNSLKTTTQYRIAGFNTVDSGFVDLNTIMIAIFR